MATKIAIVITSFDALNVKGQVCTLAPDGGVQPIVDGDFSEAPDDLGAELAAMLTTSFPENDPV